MNVHTSTNTYIRVTDQTKRRRETRVLSVDALREKRVKRTRRDYKKGSGPACKVTICIDRSIDRFSRSTGDPSASNSSFILDLIRWTGDGGHLFRRVLALCQCAALRRVELQPSIIAVHHHRAKAKELQQIHLDSRHREPWVPITLRTIQNYSEQHDTPKIILGIFEVIKS